ncbi:tetratricopeptide repeat protein [Nostoc sp.]
MILADDNLAWNNRGNALRDLGCYEEAVASFDQVLQIKFYNRALKNIDPQWWEAWNKNQGLDEKTRYFTGKIGQQRRRNHIINQQRRHLF